MPLHLGLFSFQTAADVYKQVLFRWDQDDALPSSLPKEDVQSSYAMALNNLGATYLACKEHALAKQMLERCIIEKENLFGKANPALVSTLHSLSQVLEALGDDRAAKEAQERVAHINEATLKAQQV